MFQVLQEFGLNQVRLFGFDSFEGLPETDAEEDIGVWDAGGFKCHIEVTKERLARLGIDWNRTFLIKGWFSDTLKPIGLLHISSHALDQLHGLMGAPGNAPEPIRNQLFKQLHLFRLQACRLVRWCVSRCC
ncbi:TylF/MycF/NovP-related O-methyltransferase [Leptolyngbya sp. 7M]|uniref:TylF/MycF/NovP-related O-methyltransferase n=1 Tax=Leptolyngbya sp. 7M TaxID=2812896 RepID=UPI003977AC11